jgi:NTP pyrophosphatase (non-canonical NTP hydrolase)
MENSVTFHILTQKAKVIKEKYAAQNEGFGRKKWEATDYYQGFVGDVGDLGKLIMAKNNLREYKDQDKKLAHELADCLWSILILADELGVDLEKEFLNAKLSTLGKKKNHP